MVKLKEIIFETTPTGSPNLASKIATKKKKLPEYLSVTHPKF